MPGKTLEAVLAEWQAKSKTLRDLRHEHDADLIDDIVRDVAAAADDFLCFLSETDAHLRSGRSAEWLRARFAAWERQGHAEKRQGRRYYRRVVIPHRSHSDSAAERANAIMAARRAGRL